MDLVDELKAFVATAKTGSFTAAAEQLGVSNRLTSKYVGELEARLGVRLFQRTTRRVGLTPAGEDLLARAPALLDELDDLLAGVSEKTRGYTGMIRVSAPVTFGEVYVSGMLARFAASNPGLTFDLRLHDAYVDLARDGIDLAFRIGRSDMLSLKSRKLGEMQTTVVASRDYLKAHGMPERPEDLAQHNCVLDTNRRTPRRWSFWADGVERPVEVNGNFQVNSAHAAVDLARKGFGVAFVPRFALWNEPEDGPLVSLLAGYAGDAVTLSAVYLEGRTLPRKVRALIDFAQADIKASGVL